jgi:AraC family transcriptional regulator
VAIEPALLQQVGRDWLNPDRIELIPRYMTEQDSLLQGIVSTLREELETSKIAPHLLIDSLKTTLAVRLLSKYCTIRPKLSSYEGGLAKAKLQQIKDYIDVNLDRDLKLIELAELVRLSPYHFLRLFKQSLGITPHQYIVARRVEQAKRLLERGQLSIAEVAASVGFCDQSHLARYFKRIVGVTPKQLRRFVRENSRERDRSISK